MPKHMMDLTSVSEIAAEAEKPKEKVPTASAAAAEKVVVPIEIWSKHSKWLTVWWPRDRCMRDMLAALASICANANRNMALTTSSQDLNGDGCVRASDTPISLALPRGGTLSLACTLIQSSTASDLNPSITASWGILRQFRCKIHDKDFMRRGKEGRVIGEEGKILVGI